MPRRLKNLCIWFDEAEADYKFFTGTARNAAKHLKGFKRTDFRLVVDEDGYKVFAHKDIETEEALRILYNLDNLIIGGDPDES
jgi:hypothetical protein